MRTYILATSTHKPKKKTERKKVGNIKDANARTKLSWWAFLRGQGKGWRRGLRKVAIKKGPQKCVRLRAIEMAEMRLQIAHLHL